MRIAALLLSSSLALSACVSTTTPTSSDKPQTTTAGALTTSASQASIAAQTPEIANPFLTPGTCRTVQIISSSEAAIVAELKRIEGLYGRLGGRYGIYKRNDGMLMGAQTMERYFADPRAYLASTSWTARRKQLDVEYEVKRKEWGNSQFYHPTAYCSSGADIIEDTGRRYYEPTSTKSGGLLLSVAGRSLAAIRAAAASSNDLVTVNPVSIGTPSQTRNTTATTSAPSGPRLVEIRNNGRISGNPSYVVDCSWGSKTIIRKDNKWTDGTGHTFSDRTWGLGLQDFGNKLCTRQI